MKNIKYLYDTDKDSKLKKERGIGFNEVITWIEEGKVVAIVNHPNSVKYPGQKIYVIEHEGYGYNVPFLEEGEKIILKTVFPSRKATKQFILTPISHVNKIS